MRPIGRPNRLSGFCVSLWSWSRTRPAPAATLQANSPRVPTPTATRSTTPRYRMRQVVLSSGSPAGSLLLKLLCDQEGCKARSHNENADRDVDGEYSLGGVPGVWFVGWRC